MPREEQYAVSDVVHGEAGRLDAAETCAFLDRVVDALPGSLDYDATLAAVARIAVRTIADFCVIDMVNGGTLRRVQAAHADPAREETARALMRFGVVEGRAHPSLEAVRTGSAVLISAVDASLLDLLALGAEHRAVIEQLEAKALLAVPLVKGAEVAGVILFGSSTAGFDDAAVQLGHQLARFASLELAYALQLEESKAAIVARDRVLGVVAHDLRNPLNVIGLAAAYLLEHASVAERPHLDRIVRSADRMERLIRDLLDVAQIESRQLALDSRLLDPIALVREAVEGGHVMARIRQHEVVCDLPAIAPQIEADSDRILQVLGNLIDNAIKFTPERGRIEIGLALTGAELCFTVRDNGPGIAEAERELLFEPFWRGGQRTIEGAGLGLAIARGIIDAHGGHIWAESAPGEGSAFHFTLPLRPDLVDTGSSDRR